MADLDSLIGCKISLISHQDVRYDGNLFSINQSESSIVLRDVQVFGTEDRVTDPGKIVAASVALIPFVTFPGSEIKDLYVHESQANGESNVPPPPSAPAASKPSTDSKPARNQNNRQNDHRQQAAQPPKPPADEKQKEQDHAKEQPKQEQQSNNARGSYAAAGTGSHLLKMREKRVHNANSANPTADKSEFDFQEGLSHFKKDEVFSEVEEKPVVGQKYVKDDFFDNISNDAAGLEEARKHRLTAGEERQLNQDTFGAIALTSYRGRGGRGRGGRGYGGRGRGRGGNNYNNNSYNNTNNNNNNNNGGRGGRGYNNYSNSTSRNYTNNSSNNNKESK